MTNTEIALTTLLVIPAIGMFLIFVITVVAIVKIFGRH